VAEQCLQSLAPHHAIGDEVPIPGGVAGGLHYQPVPLLALAQLGLGALTVADVLDGDYEVPGAALRVGHQRDRDQAPGCLSAPPETAVLGGVAGTLAGEEQPDRFPLDRAVVGMNDPLGEGAKQLLFPVSQQLTERPVHPGPAPLV
jgi:hypothetical protein